MRSSSTSVAPGLSSWISTRSRTGSVINLTRAEANGAAATPMVIAVINTIDGRIAKQDAQCILVPS